MKPRSQSSFFQAKLSIQKALQFVGDNSTYQKRRLAILSLTILSTGILTCKISLQGATITMLFLAASGAGQIVCPIYMSLLTSALGLGSFTIIAFVFYPVSGPITWLAYLGLGFFGRGIFVSTLIYMNEIGGERFRAWSMIVIFGMWGVSSLVSSIESMTTLPQWVWCYFFIFAPYLLGTYLLLRWWEPSPFRLFIKNQYAEARKVLDRMAEENQRPRIPYGLEGEEEQGIQYRKPTYMDFLQRPIIRKVTIPLLVVWVYREYIYYGVYLILPSLGGDYSKNYILLSISEISAVLLSYPIKLKVKRTNTFFFAALIVAFFSLLSSFTIVDAVCKPNHIVCAAKYTSRASIFMIRFASALMGNILVSYTLQAYPSNVRSMGFSLCLGVSSLGSIFVPWINEVFIYANLSGFISFAVASVAVLYFMNKLPETHGRMCHETLEMLEENSPHISLTSWATLNF